MTLQYYRYVFISAAVIILAGCGESQPSLVAPGVIPGIREISAHPERGRSQVRLDAKFGAQSEPSGPLLYVSNFSPNDVTLYHARIHDPSPRGSISDSIASPSGACLDSAGTLYVTNQPVGRGWISEYSFGQTAPSKIITRGVNTPAFCAIDAKNNLWITNIGGPNATEYLYGSKKPHTVITKGLRYPVGIAIDHSGTLYVADRDNPNVVVYAPGAKTPSRTITDGVTSPVGIALDASGNLYVANITEKNVEEYPPGGSHPFKILTQDLSTPSGVTVNKKGWLYVSNIANSTIVEFPPGSINPSKRHISKGLQGPLGLAYYPPLLP